jgi:hypothetical protein
MHDRLSSLPKERRALHMIFECNLMNADDRRKLGLVGTSSIGKQA